jgi:hypothetical protein
LNERQGYGIFVLSIRPNPDPLDTINDTTTSSPRPTVSSKRIRSCLARRFGNHLLLRRITCLQMTGTAIYLNWDPDDLLADDTMDYYHFLIGASGE